MKLAPILLWMAKVNFVLFVVDALALLVLALLLQRDVVALIEYGYFSKILLIESGIVFVIGGLAFLSSSVLMNKFREHVFHAKDQWSEDNSKRAQKKANSYILMAILLFLESLVLSLLAL